MSPANAGDFFCSKPAIVKEQLLLSWNLNNEKNLLLLQNINEEQLAVSTATRGRTVGEQLAHLHNTRINWTEFVAKPLFDKNLLLAKEAPLTMAILSGAFKASAQKITEVVHRSWDNEGKLPSFKTGLIPFISYLISHESHHRGNILLSLKQSGYKLPDALKWGLWEWGK